MIFPFAKKFDACLLKDYFFSEEEAMTKSQLIKELACKGNISVQEAEIFVRTFIDAMKETLIADGRIEIRGFGSFKMRKYNSYNGRNPRSGECIVVPQKKLPAFRVGKELKEALNE